MNESFSKPGRSRGDEAQIKETLETPSASTELRRDEHVVSYKNTNELDAATADRLRSMLLWEYPFAAATERPAKSSVTALRRQAEEELDDEAEQVFRPQFSEKRLAHPPARNPQRR